MIVQPDFPDHWKTQTLVASLGDQTAPIMVIRLWAHCQQRKTDSFVGLTATALKGICRAHAHDAQAFEAAMLASGFVERDGDTLIVHEWAETNAGLMASWQNGQKGGRPAKKKPGKNPRVSHGLSTGIPQGADGLPTDKPIREEERRGEQNSAIAEEKNKARGSKEEVIAYITTYGGLLPSDGEWFYDKMLASGWKNDGKDVKDWKATVRMWKPINVFPSQKVGIPTRFANGTNGHHKPYNRPLPEPDRA